MDDAKVTMTEVASQAISATQVDSGDSFTYEFVLDLPSVTAEDRSDLKIEIFATDATG